MCKVYRGADVWRTLVQINARSGRLCHSGCNINIIMSVSVQWEGTDRTHPTCRCLSQSRWTFMRNQISFAEFTTQNPHTYGAHINTGREDGWYVSCDLTTRHGPMSSVRHDAALLYYPFVLVTSVLTYRLYVCEFTFSVLKGIRVCEKKQYNRKWTRMVEEELFALLTVEVSLIEAALL